MKEEVVEEEEEVEEEALVKTNTESIKSESVNKEGASGANIMYNKKGGIRIEILKGSLCTDEELNDLE